MKYITVKLPGEFAPVAVLFSPYATHKTIADRMALKPAEILSAGFCRIDDDQVECTGFSTSLNCGPVPADANLIRAAIVATNRQYPARPAPVSAEHFVTGMTHGQPTPAS